MPGRLDPRTFPHYCGGLPEYMSSKGVQDRAGDVSLRAMTGCDRTMIFCNYFSSSAFPIQVFVAFGIQRTAFEG